MRLRKSHDKMRKSFHWFAISKPFLLHFVAFFHVASMFSTGVDNEKVRVDNEKAKMFSTDFIFRKQENLVDNQKCQAGFRPLCNRMFCCIFGWYFYIEIRLKYEKNILLSSSRAFSLSNPTFSLSTPVENSEARWKKATKCNKERFLHRRNRHWTHLDSIS